jgi:hypothetical protein
MDSAIDRYCDVRIDIRIWGVRARVFVDDRTRRLYRIRLLGGGNEMTDSCCKSERRCYAELVVDYCYKC